MIAVPLIRRSNQAPAMVLGYLVFCALYLGSGTFHIVAPSFLAPGGFDQAVPFLDWTVWVYLTQFLLLPWAIVAARDDVDRSYTLYTMLLAAAIAAVIFLTWPTEIARQPPVSDGLTGLAWRLLYLVDTPANCFPSLHVALALVAARALWRRGAIVLACVWPSLIALSTLTTRQHIAWDIAGGVVLAAIAILLTPRMLHLERPQLVHRTADR